MSTTPCTHIEYNAGNMQASLLLLGSSSQQSNQLPITLRQLFCAIVQRFIGAVVLLLIVSTSSLLAVPKTWNAGSGTFAWNVAGNWSPAGIPAGADDIIFPTGVNVVINAGMPGGMNTLTLQGSAQVEFNIVGGITNITTTISPALDLQGTSVLKLSGSRILQINSGTPTNSFIGVGATLIANGGGVQISGSAHTLTVNGVFQRNSSAIALNVGAGSIIYMSGAKLFYTGTISINTGPEFPNPLPAGVTLEVNMVGVGVVITSPPPAGRMINGPVIITQGLLRTNNPGTPFSHTFGSLTVQATGIMQIQDNAPLTVLGAVTYAVGAQLQYLGNNNFTSGGEFPATMNGDVVVNKAPGQVLTLANSKTITGTLSLTGGGGGLNIGIGNTLQVNGSVSSVVGGSPNGINVPSGATLRLNGGCSLGAANAIQVQNNGVLELSGSGASGITGNVAGVQYNLTSTLQYTNSSAMTTGTEFLAVMNNTNIIVACSGTGSVILGGGKTANMGFTFQSGTLNLSNFTLALSGIVNCNGGTLSGNGSTVSGLSFSAGATAIVNAPGLHIDVVNNQIGLLAINRTGGSNVLKLLDPLVLTNSPGISLVLTNGFIDNGSNPITILNTVSTTISGGSVTSYVLGALRWRVANSANYKFPVGKGAAFLPVTMKAGAASISGTTDLEVQAFTPGSGGSFAADIARLSGTEHWRVQVMQGMVSNVSLTFTTTASAQLISGLATAPAPLGTYTGFGRSFPGNPTINDMTTDNLPTLPGTYFSIALPVSPLNLLGASIAPVNNKRNISATGTITLGYTTLVTAATVVNSSLTPQTGIKLFGGMSGKRTVTGSVMGTGISFAPVKSFFPGEQVTLSVTSAQTALGVVQQKSIVLNYVAAAGVGPGTLSKIADYPTGGGGASSVRSITGDFNGDGKLDVVLINQNTNTLYPWFNNGVGGFTAGPTTGLGASVGSAIEGDFDGDGDLDIAVANNVATSVTIYFNNGAGNFIAGGATTVMGGVGLGNLLSADFDSDGDLDMMAYITSIGQCSVLLNNGNGSNFSSQILSPNIGVNSILLGLKPGDYDSDGDPDVLVRNTMTGTLTVWVNDHSGGFTSGGIVAAPGSNLAAVGAADLNGDNDLDLVAVYDNTVQVFFGGGGTTFGGANTYAFPSVGDAAGGNSVTLADFDGDGSIDIAAGGKLKNFVTLLKNNGTGSFNRALTTSVASPSGPLAYGDFDGDGDIDLVMPSQGNTMFSLLLNVTPPVLTATTPINGTQNVAQNTSIQTTFNVAMTTATASGGVVKVFGSLSGLSAGAYSTTSTATGLFQPTEPFKPGEFVSVSVTNAQSSQFPFTTRATVFSFRALAGAAPATFAIDNTLDVGTQPQSVAAGDFNGDGAVDYAVVNNGSDNISIFYNLNDGTGGFDPAITLITPNKPEAIIAVDMNNDGKLDLVTTHRASALGLVVVFSNLGASFSQISSTLVNGQGAETLVAADFDGDGDMDIAVASSASSQISILYNNGAGGFPMGNIASFTTSEAIKDIDVADLDLDGDMDIVAAGVNNLLLFINSTPGTNSGSNSAAWLPIAPILTGLPTHNALVCADFNGDGKPDIAIAGTNSIAFFQNQGGTALPTLAGTANVPNNSNIRDMIVGDFNGDGNLDIATANKNSDAVSVLLNNGGVSFTNSFTSTLTTGAKTRALATADLDGDGDLDIIAVNESLNTSTILLNKSAAPIITALSPLQSLGSGGGFLTITGANLDLITTIVIAGVPVTTIANKTPTQLIVIIPPSGGESRSGLVTASGTQGSTSSTQTFLYVDAPKITNIAPLSGAPGTAVTITGKNFLFITSATFGGAFAAVSAASYTVLSTTQILAVVGNGNTGAITVANFAGADSSLSVFTIKIVASIDDFTPKIGTSGTVVTITGQNLGLASSVLFNGIAASGFTVLSTTQVQAVVPPKASTGNISIVLSALNYTAQSVQPFSILQPPTITTFTPTTGTFSVPVTITGTSFQTVTSVTVGGVPVAGFTIVSPTQITVTPAASEQGAVSGSIRVLNAVGSTTTSQQFSYIKQPLIFSYSPTFATAGTVLIVTGANFSALTEVSLGGVRVTFATVSNSLVTVLVSTTANSGFLRITNPAGSVVALQQFNFIAPEPASLTPIQRDSSILVKFYLATGGATTWRDTTNWLTATPVNTWFGVAADTVGGSTSGNLRVTSVSLASNNLTGVIPAILGGLKGLKILNLAGNKFSGTIPSSIATLTRLEELYVNNNNLTGDLSGLFPETGTNSLANIRVLRLDSNSLSGVLPAGFCGLPNIRELRLNANKLTGEIPSCIGTLKNIVVLDLSNNQFSGAIPSTIGSLVNLQELNLARNNLTGVLPATIGSTLATLSTTGTPTFLAAKHRTDGSISTLVALLKIDVSNNQLSGAIPSSLWNLAALREVNLSYNTFDSTLPLNIGSAKALRTLALRNNRLSGTIPASLGQLDSLRILTLDSNLLDGTVPATLKNLSALQELGLSGNRLDTLPALAPLKPQILRLDGNQFTFGSILANVGIASSFTYTRQDSIGTARDTIGIIGRSFKLTVNTDGTDNRYQWYRLRTAADGSVSKQTVGSLNRSADLVLPLFAAIDTGAYLCRVTNNAASKLELWTRPITVGARLPAAPTVLPLLISPVSISTVRTLATFSWRGVSTATFYVMELGTTSTFNTTTSVVSWTVRGTDTTVNGLTPLTTYFWRVRAGNEGGFGNWSSTATFTTLRQGVILTANTVDFGRVVLGTSTRKLFSLTNLSEKAIVLQSLTPKDPTPFTVIGQIANTIVAAGQTAQVTIEFAPKTTGSVQQDITCAYTTNGVPSSDTFAGVLLGRAGLLTVGNTTFDTTNVGRPIPTQVEVFNKSDEDVRITPSVPAGSVFKVSPLMGENALIKANSSKRLDIAYTLEVAGITTDTLKIASEKDTVFAVLSAVGVNQKIDTLQMTLMLRSERNNVAPGDTTTLVLSITQGNLGDIVRALTNATFSAKLSFDHNVLVLDAGEQNLTLDPSSTSSDYWRYTIKPTLWEKAKTNDILLRFRCLSVAGAIDTTRLIVVDGSFTWAPGEPQPKIITNQFIISTTSATFTSGACQAGGTRLVQSTTKLKLSHSAPNPVNDETLISYSIREQGVVVLALYDMQGTLVRTLTSSVHAPGEYQTLLQTNNLASGVYMLTLQTPSALLSERLHVVK